MKTRPIVPAEIVFEPGQPPRSPQYGDVYHPRAGALTQARHVFLAGNGLPLRWRGRDRFTVLETGFGLGLNLLATWQAWRDDPQRCRRLNLVSIERHPPTPDALARAWAEADPALAALGAPLLAAWPPATPNLHLLPLEGGAVQWLLAWGDVDDLLPHLELQADAVYLDGFAPDRNPQMWSPRVLAAIGRKAAPGATVATWSVARAVRDGLTTAGFALERRPGIGGKRETLAGRFEPRPGVRAAPRRQPLSDRGHALIVGAGLAGACAADALARAGWRCTVLDCHPAPGMAASGNPGGLFHPTAHGEDGVHARFTRAAALLAAQRYRPLIEAGRVAGAVDGVLRLRPGPRARHLGLPSELVQRLDVDAASTLAGVLLPGEADRFGAAGWVDPAALCRQLLSAEGIAFRGDTAVGGAQRVGARWRVHDIGGSPIAEGDALVVATGAATGWLPFDASGVDEPIPVRGQVSWCGGATVPELRLQRPLTGHGYALRLPDGRLLFGATSQPGDDEPRTRDDDHRHNADRLQALLGRPAGDAIPAEACEGRVGWRATLPDRLPMVGAWPCPPGEGGPPGVPDRRDQCRRVPRVPGLYVIGGLGSRGLTWGPLLGEVLSAWICGDPMPLEADLLDAVDPARGAVRRWRAAAGPQATGDQPATDGAGGAGGSAPGS